MIKSIRINTMTFKISCKVPKLFERCALRRDYDCHDDLVRDQQKHRIFTQSFECFADSCRL
jgi:hypothetical protein